ncbi:DNA polymerase III subunit delta' [Chromatium okenii]|uniref:DNA polymerase III subunit delta' n=1 Tax=Chromatium okenii TaxID=61644 RepID=UPI0026E93A5A|nr:DNA polymerase III subunit delta' [Chromatium okenii]MBV5311416.1 DNA polymerase III subunit delta' [Chromatium okenii]
MTTPSLSVAALPWLTEIWAGLQTARAADRLAHGLLISGPQGVGKRLLAEQLAHSLLCPHCDHDGVPCGTCADCHLLAAGTHPDLTRLSPDPEAKSNTITIDTIRAFTEHESLTPSRAPRKIVLIDPADRLNTAAANALLKTLEEPAGRTILCLIGEHIGQLPATIRSRCQHLKVPIPAETVALAWLRSHTTQRDQTLRLRLAHGAPLRALTEFNDELLEQRRLRLAGFLAIAAKTHDPVAEAAIWNTQGAAQMLDWLAGWLCDLLRLMVAQQPPRLNNPDHQGDFAALAGRISPAAGHRLLRRILEAEIQLNANINPLLILESLAIEWAQINVVHRKS